MKKHDWMFWSFIFLVAIVFVAMVFPKTEEVEAAFNPQPIEESVMIYDVPLEPELQTHIKQLCDSYGVDMPLVLAIIGQESNYQENAVGDRGNSIGLMQIQPQHHQSRMDKLGVTDLLEPKDNVEVGIDILAELLREQDTEWAVTAYNAGKKAADFNKQVGIRSEYAESVMTLREDIANEKQ